jgi:uncharacterized membrane protein YheB (UPF0754 family)
MTTRTILTLTLLATTLTLSAAVPKEVRETTRQQTNSISKAIASVLYRRGIEEDKAIELSSALISTDEELFSLMLHNLIFMTGLHKEEVLEYLGKQALNKKRVDLSSYASLVKISQSLTKEALAAKDLQNIKELSSKNELLMRVFS